MVVVGAGIAGLACAQALAGDRQVVVLEARNRVGGRVHTLRMPSGEVVELGAQVVHPTLDPVLDRIIRMARIRAVPLELDTDLFVVTGDERWDAAGIARDRPPAPWVVERQLGTRFPGRGTVTEALVGLPDASRALAGAWLDQVLGGDCKTLDLQSVASAREARPPGREVVLVDGFDQVTAAGAADLDIRLACPVETIRWSEHGVEIVGAVRLTARAAVVTVPPSVVLAGGITFSPALPAEKTDALAALASADALAVVLTTSAVALRSRCVLLADPPYGLWRTNAGSVVVVGHVKGPAVVAARSWDWSVDRASEVVGALDPALGPVTSVALHDWGADPWARGAYSTPVAGADVAARRWARPVGGVLHFAGEASADASHRGLVQGALTTGGRAAREIVGRPDHGTAEDSRTGRCS